MLWLIPNASVYVITSVPGIDTVLEEFPIIIEAAEISIVPAFAPPKNDVKGLR
jgi:hypothetical protein